MIRFCIFIVIRFNFVFLFQPFYLNLSLSLSLCRPIPFPFHFYSLCPRNCAFCQIISLSFSALVCLFSSLLYLFVSALFLFLYVSISLSTCSISQLIAFTYFECALLYIILYITLSLSLFLSFFLSFFLFLSLDLSFTSLNIFLYLPIYSLVVMHRLSLYGLNLCLVFHLFKKFCLPYSKHFILLFLFASWFCVQLFYFSLCL